MLAWTRQHAVLKGSSLRYSSISLIFWWAFSFVQFQIERLLITCSTYFCVLQYIFSSQFSVVQVLCIVRFIYTPYSQYVNFSILVRDLDSAVPYVTLPWMQWIGFAFGGIPKVQVKVLVNRYGVKTDMKVINMLQRVSQKMVSYSVTKHFYI